MNYNNIIFTTVTIKYVLFKLHANPLTFKLCHMTYVGVGNGS